MASKMTKTKTYSTMICRGPTMSICKQFVRFFRSINDFQLIYLKEFTLSDPLISADKLFHSRIVLGKKDFEKISLRIKGTRRELFLRRLHASVLWGIRLQICLK